jgi:hypothetical protein
MPNAEAARKKRKLWFVALAITGAVLGSVAFCAGGAVLLGSWGSQLDPHHTRPEEVAQREAALRQGGPAEADARRVEAALVRAADTVAAQHPGVVWHWGERPLETLDCNDYHMFQTTPPEQIVLRHILFEGPLTDAARNAAVAVFEEQAKTIGAPLKDSFTTSDRRSGVMFSRSPGDIAMVFTSGRVDPAVIGNPTQEQQAAAVVEGRSACLFPQQYFTDRHLATPSH